MRKPTILCVDDEPVGLAGLESLLRRQLSSPNRVWKRRTTSVFRGTCPVDGIGPASVQGMGMTRDSYRYPFRETDI